MWVQGAEWTRRTTCGTPVESLLVAGTLITPDVHRHPPDVWRRGNLLGRPRWTVYGLQGRFISLNLCDSDDNIGHDLFGNSNYGPEDRLNAGISRSPSCIWFYIWLWLGVVDWRPSFSGVQDRSAYYRISFSKLNLHIRLYCDCDLLSYRYAWIWVLSDLFMILCSPSHILSCLPLYVFSIATDLSYPNS